MRIGPRSLGRGAGRLGLGVVFEGGLLSYEFQIERVIYLEWETGNGVIGIRKLLCAVACGKQGKVFGMDVTCPKSCYSFFP